MRDVVPDTEYIKAVKAGWRKDEIIQYLLDTLNDIEQSTKPDGQGALSVEAICRIACAAINKVETWL